MSSAQEIDFRVIDFDFTDMTWSTVDYSEKPALQVRCQRGWQQTAEIWATNYNCMQMMCMLYMI